MLRLIFPQRIDWPQARLLALATDYSLTVADTTSLVQGGCNCWQLTVSGKTPNLTAFADRLKAIALSPIGFA